MTVNGRLKELRTAKDKTQEEVATVLGVSTNTYFAWENGRKEVSFLELTRLAAYYEVPFSYLIEENPSEIPEKDKSNGTTDKIKKIKEIQRDINQIYSKLEKYKKELEVD